MKNTIMVALVALMMVGVANAGSLEGKFDGNVVVTKNGITKDGGTGTIGNSAMPHEFIEDVFIMPGGSITIEAGVIFKSEDTGSLVITRGAKIFVNGTAQEPVIMTSKQDTLTSWHEGAQEWGSLAILGNAYISGSHYKNVEQQWQDENGVIHTNTKCPGNNKKEMEGLVAEAGDPTSILYGGEDDCDDSGSIKYLSLRYGGRDTNPQKELNGISMGGLGRATDISYVDIMNNVDDGMEIWGGTVKVDHISIWNIGDDSFDFDQGWRGCAEYGLIVQGYSVDASQGSGVGDNCFEHDGAEDADAQPVTTAKIKKFTAVGQPVSGDHGTAWRDNARVQYEKCIWMDLGEKLIKFDDVDTDGGNGYSGVDKPMTDPKPYRGGGNGSKTTSGDGTLAWNEHWTTSYNQWLTSGKQDPRGCGIDFDALYGQWICQNPDLPLCDISDSVFYNIADMGEYPTIKNNVGGDYTGASLAGNVTSSDMPIRSLTRGPSVTKGGKTMQPVLFIDPMPVGDAFAKNAGGFDCHNWLVGWTAAYAYGYTSGSADLNCDGEVNLEDQAIISTQWLD